MKVLYLVCFYPGRGEFTVTKELAQKLSEKGIEIKILSTIPRKYDNKKLNFLNELPYKVQYLEEQALSSFIPAFSLKLIKKIKEEKVDMVHVHGPFYFHSLATYISNMKYIISLHGTFMKEAYETKRIKKAKKDLYMGLIGKYILKKSRAIIVNTQEEKKHFLDYYPYLIEKLKIIPNGMDISHFYNHTDDTNGYFYRNNPQKDKKIIVFLGRLSWIKGLDILIKGFSHLYNENKEVHLLIAGKDGGDGYENKVRSWVRKFGLEKAVTFTGFLDGKDKINVLCSSDVFILPSYSENFGMAVIEAMAAGLPVVVTNRVAISNEISQWKAGIIIDCSEKGVYEGLKEAINMDDNIKNKMIARGRSMVNELYDINRVADRMIELYKDISKS
jgi:glycosyltransferase involved in cell wall biosynthesis